MTTKRVLSAATVAASLLMATTADAAVVDGSQASSRDESVAGARDFKRVSSTFDGATGTWTMTVTFYGRLTSRRDARFYAFLQQPGSDPSCGTGVAQLRARTDPQREGGSVSVCTPAAPGGSTTVPATKTMSNGGRTMTLRAQSDLMRDFQPQAVVSSRISFYRVFDRIGTIKLL